MPIWSWFFIAAAVLIAFTLLLIGVLRVTRGMRTERLREQFGPEYDRAIDEAGDQQAGEDELVVRERQRHKLEIVALSAEAHSKYAEEWRRLQTAFVDDPATAVGAADQLVTDVMRERGYPVNDFDRQAADISVDHPNVVEHYRAAHVLYSAQDKGDIGTEAQREAFVHYRALFDKLLETDVPADTGAPKEARA